MVQQGAGGAQQGLVPRPVGLGYQAGFGEVSCDHRQRQQTERLGENEDREGDQVPSVDGGIEQQRFLRPVGPGVPLHRREDQQGQPGDRRQRRRPVGRPGAPEAAPAQGGLESRVGAGVEGVGGGQRGGAHAGKTSLSTEGSHFRSDSTLPAEPAAPYWTFVQGRLRAAGRAVYRAAIICSPTSRP